ncbi:MAG: hypothetical protein ACSLE0_15770 [Chitinophagaceae bacterium]
MKKEYGQMALALVAFGLLIFLTGKKVAGKKKKRGQDEKDNEFLSTQRKKHSDAFGEYTL